MYLEIGPVTCKDHVDRTPLTGLVNGAYAHRDINVI
jgi:hypothetical protein